MSKAWPVENPDCDATVLVNARRVLAVRIAELYSYAPVVTHPDAGVALHDMRIAAKRLRYSLELFRPELGKNGQRQIERVKALQEALGTLHDHDVRIALIADELARVAAEQSAITTAALAEAQADQVAALAAAALRPPPDDPRRGLIALLGREHGARRAAYDRFRVLWDRLAAEGMRADLVALSVTPLAEVEARGENAG
jgi:hypothetical protein